MRLIDCVTFCGKHTLDIYFDVAWEASGAATGGIWAYTMCVLAVGDFVLVTLLATPQ